MPYADRTEVPASKSRLEIERLLQKYGADSFGFGWDGPARMQAISFRRGGRWYKIHVTLPDPATLSAAKYSQEERRQWRVLLLVLKAMLEYQEVTGSPFEKMFMPYAQLPNGQTASDWIEPLVKQAYVDGKMPKQLPWLEGK
jgi:hypothetical protein